MIEIRIQGRLFIVEFRHVSRLGRKRQLYDRAPVKAVTTCVIVCQDPRPRFDNKIEFVAIDNAICAVSDNFDRREGRKQALRKVLRHCGALKDVREKLWAEWLNQDPTPERVLKHVDPGAAPPVCYYRINETVDSDQRIVADPPRAVRLHPDRVADLKATGQQGKWERRTARKQKKREARTAPGLEYLPGLDARA